MKYVSVDLEATDVDVDAETTQVLQVSAILEDTKNLLPFNQIPKFTRYIKHQVVTGNPRFLYLNANSLKIIGGLDESKQHLICKPESFFIELYNWLFKHGYEFKIDLNNRHKYIKVNTVGKNIGSFDLPLLRKLPNSHFIKFGYRNGDPTTLFVDWQNDEEFPDLSICKQRAGLSPEINHDSELDAWDVIQSLRTKY